MDITNYLSNIEVPSTNEDQVKLFLTSNKEELKKHILLLWDNFVLAESKKTSIAQPTIADNRTETEITSHTSTVHASNEKLGNSEIIENLPKSDQEETLAIPEDPGQASPQQDKPSIEVLKTDLKDKAKNEEIALIIKNKFITLPNGKVGQPYNFIFSTEKIGVTDIEDFWIEGLEPLGLSFDTVSNSITGTPIVSGEQTIMLFLKRNGWSQGKPIFERKLTLTINPDPRSLWLNKPSDLTDQYWKPDSAKQFLNVESTGIILKTEHKDIVAASQRGRSHAHEGIFRDDDFAMDYNKNTNWYILAVADGAGSCKASRKGSQIACQTVLDVCKTHLENGHKDFERLIKELNNEMSDANRKKMGDSLYGIIGSAVFKAYKNIEEEATISGKQTKDFSTTLIVSICKKFKFGWFVAAFWVGDGGIGIYDKNRRFLRVLGESDGGEFAGQTRFLTMPEITQPAELYRRLRFDIVEDFTALILMSDGITDPKFETDANLSRIEKWDELWNDLSAEVDFTDNNEKSADQLLTWLDFWSPGNHDDRTIAILF